MTDSAPPPKSGQHAKERGSAAVDFVLVGTVLTLLFLAVVQLALVLHVRNTLIDAASSGAHFGVLADRAPADSVGRTRSLIASSLNPGFAGDVSYARQQVGGVPTLVVTVRAPLPVIGLIGFPSMLTVSGHAALQN